MFMHPKPNFAIFNEKHTAVNQNDIYKFRHIIKIFKKLELEQTDKQTSKS